MNPPFTGSLPTAARLREPSLWLAPVLVLALALPALAACAGGYAHRTAEFRDRLDHYDAQGALAEIDALVIEAEQTPALQSGPPDDSDYPLLLLERASLHQAVGDHQAAVADFGGADQMLEILDLTPSGIEEVGDYLFSGDSGLYRPPVYEKLMINVSALASYLALGDYAGARVEARRLSVLLAYFENTELADHPMLGAAHYMAGLAYELSDEPATALRYYIDAYQVADAPGLAEAIARLSHGTVLGNRPEVGRARAQLGLGADAPPPAGAEQEVVALVFSGLAPRREPEYFPIGIALSWVGTRYTFAPHYHPLVTRIKAEDLLTWINFPVLVTMTGQARSFRVSGGARPEQAELVADIESFALSEWEQERPGIAFAAITRTLTRILAREAIQAAGNDSTEARLLSYVVQGGMQLADTPDTRSWTSMPARLWISRIAVAPGPQTVTIAADGASSQSVDVDVPAGGNRVVTVRFLE